MDLIKALSKWETLGGTVNSYDDEQGNYVIDFINKDGEVEGWFKTYPGQGFRWQYPDSLFYTQEDLQNECELNAFESTLGSAE